jgi:hypothetical protein
MMKKITAKELSELDELLGEDKTEPIAPISNDSTYISILEKILEFYKSSASISSKSVNLINQLNTSIQELKGKLEGVLKVKINNQVLPEFPTSIEVKNIPKIEIPKSFSISNQIDYNKTLDGIHLLLSQLIKLSVIDKEIKVNLDRYMDKRRPISVRLSDGREFYTAIVNAIAASGGVDTTGLATDSNQTDGSQKTQIVDSEGDNYNALNPLPVSATIDTAGLATSAKQLPDNHQVTANLSIADNGLLSDISDDTGNTALSLGSKTDAKNSATDGTSVSIISILKEISYMEQTPASRAVTNNGTFAVQSTGVSPTTIYNGIKTVTTAGTQVALAASTTVKSVTVKALRTNTNLIYVGDSSVSNTTGFQLSPGDTISMDIADLATVYIDSVIDGEGVSFIAIN